MSSRTLKVVLEFSEADLNQIMAYTFVGDAPPAVADMSKAQFGKLGKLLQASSDAFVDEIVEGSGDDGDWLYKFMKQFK